MVKHIKHHFFHHFSLTPSYTNSLSTLNSRIHGSQTPGSRGAEKQLAQGFAASRFVVPHCDWDHEAMDERDRWVALLKALIRRLAIPKKNQKGEASNIMQIPILK